MRHKAQGKKNKGVYNKEEREKNWQRKKGDVMFDARGKY